MGRIEKTVFISYRRTNYWTALAVYQNLHANGYDVFFDYKSIPSGDFEQAIIENITSRAHFIVILSSSALDRCHEPGDWLRREIETAIEYQRNVIPLVMEGFNFGDPATIKALTGNLADLKKYNAMGIPVEYFDEAMAKLRSNKFLNRPLESVSHQVSQSTRKVIEEQQSAANEAAPVKTEQLTAQEWFERGYVFQRDKNFDEATRCYSEAIQLNPKLHTAHNNLGNIFSKLKRYEEAEAAYHKAIELKPNDATAYINLGLLLHEKLKRYDEAEVNYRKAIELSEASPSGGNPDEATAYSNLGNTLQVLKRYEEAEAAYRKAIELKPNDATAYINLGSLLGDLKRYDEADVNYRKAIELTPDEATAYYNLGNLLGDENLKRYEEAEENYRKAIELNPNLTGTYSNLGILLKNLKRYDEAEAAFRKAIELSEASPSGGNPDYATAYINLGSLLNDLKHYDEAEVNYRKAIELDPDFSPAYSNLGSLLQNLKRYDEAEVNYRKAIELNPDEATAYNNLVIMLRIMGREKEITPLLEKIIEINPQDFNAYLALASMDKQAGRQVSKEHTEKARQFMLADDWYNRACLESVSDNFDLAFEFLEKAAKQERFNPAWAWEDPDLQWIRDDPRFTEIVGPKPT